MPIHLPPKTRVKAVPARRQAAVDSIDWLGLWALSIAFCALVYIGNDAFLVCPSQRVALTNELTLSEVVEGPNFNFGKNRRGTIARLREWSAESQIELHVLDRGTAAAGERVVSTFDSFEQLGAIHGDDLNAHLVRR